MEKFISRFRLLFVTLFLALPTFAMSDDITPFIGSYRGEAEFTYEGNVQRRDMRTEIEETSKGFIVNWTSVSYRANGGTKEKSYTIEFSPSMRDNIYKSEMKKNLFGKATPLDPLQGEPFVWARIEGETLSVFSLFINEIGEYEVQEFHRTLVPAGLDLVFRRVHDGKLSKEIRTVLVRQ